MDWMAAIPMIIDGITQLGATAMSALLARLLTIALAAIIIGSVAGFALGGFFWLWFRHTLEELLHIGATPARS